MDKKMKYGIAFLLLGIVLTVIRVDWFAPGFFLSIGLFLVIPLALLYIVLTGKRKLYSAIMIPISLIGFGFVLIASFFCPAIYPSNCPNIWNFLPSFAWLLLLIGSLYSLIKHRKGAQS